MEIIDTPGTANGIYISRDRVYVADGTAGLQILDLMFPVDIVVDRGARTYGFDRHNKRKQVLLLTTVWELGVDVIPSEAIARTSVDFILRMPGGWGSENGTVNLECDFRYDGTFTDMPFRSTTGSARHVFAAPGRYRIACRLRDDLGGVGFWTGECVVRQR